MWEGVGGSGMGPVDSPPMGYYTAYGVIASSSGEKTLAHRKDDGPTLLPSNCMPFSDHDLLIRYYGRSGWSVMTAFNSPPTIDSALAAIVCRYILRLLSYFAGSKTFPSTHSIVPDTMTINVLDTVEYGCEVGCHRLRC